jgi:hypothetical protein
MVEKNFKILNISANLDNYANIEGYENISDKTQIEYFKKTNIIPSYNISSIISLLERIKEIARNNQTNIQERINNVEIAKNIIASEIEKLKSETTLQKLYNQKIDNNILSICAEQFNLYYSKITELKYRQNILSYKILFLKQQQQDISEDIEKINKYIIALQEL